MSDADQTNTNGAIHLKDENFEQTIKDAGMPVMVDFYAEWCGPCQMAAPIVDKLAEEYAGQMLIVKMDVDENRDTAGKYGVMSIPTVMIFKANEAGEVEKVDEQVGFPGEDGFRKLIEKHLN